MQVLKFSRESCHCRDTALTPSLEPDAPSFAGQEEINPTPSDKVNRGQRVLLNLGEILIKNRHKQIKT